MNKRRLIPLFAAFVLWGSQYVISKIALRTVPPVTLLALRYLVSVPALFIVLRLRHALTPVKKGDWPILFAIGFTGYFASFCLQMLGINRLTQIIDAALNAYGLNPVVQSLIIDGIFEGKIQLYVHDVDDVRSICNNLKQIQNIKQVVRIED